MTEKSIILCYNIIDYVQENRTLHYILIKLIEWYGNICKIVQLFLS